MKLGQAFFVLFIFLCSSAVAGGEQVFDRLTNGKQEIIVDWDRGIIQGEDIGVSWNIYSCDPSASYICLIIEGIGVEVAYPKSIREGASWDFDGRNYRLAMVSGDELLIVSRFSDAVMNQVGGPDKNRINLIKVNHHRLIEYVSFEDSSGFSENFRWASVDSEGIALIRSGVEPKTKLVSEKIINKCIDSKVFNCLNR
jgi:hypothetical protein